MATAQHGPLNLDAVPSAATLRIAVVVSEWNAEITANLYEGAHAVLQQKDCSDIQRIDVPGSFELIYGCKKMQEKNVDVVIAIGSIIRGETKHFDFICNAISIGIKDLNVSKNCPIIFCVLTDDTMQQAIDRSGGKYGNKGTEAAIAAIKMALI